MVTQDTSGLTFNPCCHIFGSFSIFEQYFTETSTQNVDIVNQLYLFLWIFFCRVGEFWHRDLGVEAPGSPIVDAILQFSPLQWRLATGIAEAVWPSGALWVPASAALILYPKESLNLFSTLPSVTVPPQLIVLGYYLPFAPSSSCWSPIHCPECISAHPNRSNGSLKSLPSLTLPSSPGCSALVSWFWELHLCSLLCSSHRTASWESVGESLRWDWEILRGSL